MLVSASAGASASVEEGLRETRVEDLEFLGASVPRESREMGWKSASSLTLLRCCFAAVAAAAANDGAEAFEVDERRRPRPPSYGCGTKMTVQVLGWRARQASGGRAEHVATCQTAPW